MEPAFSSTAADRWAISTSDGWPDLFLLGGGDLNTADALYINDGDGTFTDEAAAWGVDRQGALRGKGDHRRRFQQRRLAGHFRYEWRVT